MVDFTLYQAFTRCSANGRKNHATDLERNTQEEWLESKVDRNVCMVHSLSLSPPACIVLPICFVYTPNSLPPGEQSLYMNEN